MLLILNEEDLKNLRTEVREATRRMVPNKHKGFPLEMIVVMSYNGNFETVSSCDDDNGVYLMPVVSICRPYFNTPRVFNPANPHNLYAEIASSLFDHVENQIKGYMTEYITETVENNRVT